MANYNGYKGVYTPSTSFGRKFAEKSRFDSMIAQMDEDTKYKYVNDPGFREAVDTNFGFKQQFNNPIFQDPAYKTSSVKNRGALEKVLDFLQTGSYASAGFATGLVKGEGLNGALQRAGEGITAGFTGDDAKSYHYSDVLKEAGAFEGHDKVRGVVGFLGDVLLDPTTYLGIGLADDIVKGTGKVVKGTVNGAEDIITKTGGKSTIKAMTEDDAVKVFKSIKGDNYIPKADEVSELIRRTNKTRGIREVSPITAFGKEIVSGDTMSAVRSPLRALGDKTIAPYVQKAKDFLVHSKLSNNGKLVDLARSNPVALKNYFDFAEEAGKHGLSHAQAVAKAEEQFSKLDGMSDDTNSLVLKLMEDEKLYNKLSKQSVKETEDFMTKDAVRGEQTTIDDLYKNEKQVASKSNTPNLDEFLRRTQDPEHFKGYKVYEKPKETPEMSEVAIDRVKASDEIASDTNVKMPNPYEFRSKILSKKEIASKYNIDTSKMPLVIKNRQGDLVDGNTGELVNFLKEDNLEKASMTELKDIARKFKITNGSKYTKDNKNLLIDEIRAKFDKRTPLKEARTNIINPNNYTKYTSLQGKAINDITEIPGFKTEDLPRYLNYAGKQQLLNDILKSDKWMNNVFKYLDKNKVLTTNIPEKELDNVLSKYLSGETQSLVSITHRFHKDYGKVSQLVNKEFGDYTKLGDTEKAQRMARIWEYYNNPGKLSENYSKLEQERLMGGVDRSLGEYDKDVERVLRDTTFTDLNTGKQWIKKGNTPDVSKSIERQIYDQDKALSELENARGKVRDYDGGYSPTHLTDESSFANNEIKFSNKALGKSYKKGALKDINTDLITTFDKMLKENKKSLPEDFSLKLIEAELTGGKLTKEDVISAMKEVKFGGKAEAESTLGLATDRAEVARKKLESAVKTKNTTVNNVLKLNNLNDELIKNGNLKNQVDELGKLPKEIQNKVVNPSKETQLTINTVNRFKDDKYEYTTNLLDMAKKKVDAVNSAKTTSEAEVKGVVSDVVSDEKIVDDAVKLTDTEKLALKYAKELKKTFKDIGAKEVEAGKLNKDAYEQMLSSYISHVMTPQAKGLWEGLKKTNPDMYNLFKTGNKTNQHSLKRTFAKGTTLPDGYVLKTGSIDEINDHMKQYLNGNKLFADKVSDIYLSRMVAHENVMYDYKLADDMVSKFGIKASAEDMLQKGESGIIKTTDVKQALRNATPEQKTKFYADLGIDEHYFEGTYKPFMKLDGKQFNYFKKSKSIPVYKVNDVMIDKADKLAKNQFATDLHVTVKMYDKFLTLWKTTVTAVRPSFHFRNAQSNAFQNYLDVGSRAINPVFGKKMLDVVNGKEGTHTILGKKYTYEELRDKAVQYGVLDKGFFEKDLAKDTITALDGKINPKYNPLNTKEFAVYKAGRKLGNMVENQARMANFVANLERGKGFQEASEHVNKFLFDYSDLTPFEQNVMKRIVPFYTWLRKNVPLQAEMITSAPYKYLPFVKAVDRLNQDKKNAPNYADSWVQLPYTTKDKNGKEYQIMWNNSLPYNDLGKLTSAKDMWGGVTPFIKIPVELIAGKNIYFGQDISGNRASYVQDQIPGVYETKKLSKSSGGQKTVAVSDYAFGTGLKTLETEDSKKANTNRFSAIYQNYLKEKGNK